MLLWFDLTTEPHDSGYILAGGRYFNIFRCTRLAQAEAQIERVQPVALCFDFDQPDRRSLQAMQDAKRTHPGLPILMLTTAHSEALAVWAFRARVWNYLVKPLPMSEFLENLDAVSQVVARTLPRRMMQPLVAIIPADLSFERPNPHIVRMQPATRYLREHFHEKVSECDVARLCGMSPFVFSREFHATFGMTFHDYLVQMRIAEARRLLAENGKSVTAVAYAAGFNDCSYFARVFKRHTGMLPSEFRVRAHAPKAGAAEPEDPDASPGLAAGGVRRREPATPAAGT